MFLKCWLMIRRSLNLNEAFYQQFLSKRFVQLAKLIQHWTKFILRINWSLLTSRCQVIKFICQSRFISKINNHSSSTLSRCHVIKSTLCQSTSCATTASSIRAAVRITTESVWPRKTRFRRIRNLFQETTTFTKKQNTKKTDTVMPILSIIIVIKDQMVQINIPESYKKKMPNLTWDLLLSTILSKVTFVCKSHNSISKLFIR